MRIGELSARSGVPIPTIKYYLREGLLDAGHARAANQADYTSAHLQRLRLIRALIDVGGVPVAATRAIIWELNRADVTPHDLLGAAHHAVTPSRTPDRSTDEWRAARAEAATFVASRGWLVSPYAPGLDLLADALAALGMLHMTELLAMLNDYADAAERISRPEVAAVVARGEPARMIELVVIGTVLGEAVLTSMRLLAQEHMSAQHFMALAADGTQWTGEESPVADQ